MAAKLSEGDTITMTGEVTLVHDEKGWNKYGQILLCHEMRLSCPLWTRAFKRTFGSEGVGFFRDNETDAMLNTTLAVREWVGLVAYWLSGRIDSVFPGPGRGHLSSRIAARADEKNCLRISTVTRTSVESANTPAFTNQPR